MKQLITIDLTARTCDWTPPVLTFGESLTLQCRFTKTINGNSVEPNLQITGAKASIGKVDARPGGGTFALQFGTSPTLYTTADLPHDCTPGAMAAAINATTGLTAAFGTCTVKKVFGSWLLRFGTGSAQVPFQVINNQLWPVTFGVINAGQLTDNKWVHELRLTQAPVSFVGGDPNLALPGTPSCSVLIHGGSSGTGQVWDTVQQLFIPSDFRGTYRIKMGNVRTALLNETSSADEIQAACVTAFGAGIVVTLPFSFRFYIDLGGTYAGTDVAELAIEGGIAPAQDLFLEIPLDRFELARLLTAGSPQTFPLEIRLTCTEDGSDPQEIVALSIPVTIQAALAMPILDELQTIDWLRFPSPTTYVGPGVGVYLTGEKIYANTMGDGSATTFVLAHGLSSSDVVIDVKLNGAPGTQLVNGTDYRATVDNTNQVTVTALTGAPAAGAWRIMVVAAKEIASWAPDLLINQSQVIGLEDRIAADEADIALLKTLIPANASLPAGTAPANALTIAIPPTSEILFAFDANRVPITDPTKLPTGKPPFMLPALNTTTIIGALPTSPQPTPAAGALYTTAAATLITSGGHIRSSMSDAGGDVGSDGRINYPVRKSGTKDSYFPEPFERTLFEVMINDMMFSSGTVLTCLFKLGLQLINPNSEAQWVLAIEQGLITKVTTPGTPDTNLLDVVWQTATPLVLQPLDISTALQTAGFGCTIANNAGVFTANGLVFKRTLSATANVQQTANFGLRAILKNFDPKDSVTDARGWVSWSLQNPDNGILGISIV